MSDIKKRVELFLIGVVHRDPRGGERLDNLLASLRPQAVTVEISPLSIRFRRRYAARMRVLLLRNIVRLACENGVKARELCRKPAFRDISLQLALPFEYQSAMKAGREFGCSVAAVDSSEHARLFLRLLKELPTLDNLRAIEKTASTSLVKKSESEYRRAARYLANPYRTDELFLGWDDATRLEWETRERRMATSINGVLQSLEQQGGGVCVHVGGWMHTVTGGMENLLRYAPREKLLLGTRNVFTPGP